MTNWTLDPQIILDKYWLVNDSPLIKGKLGGSTLRRSPLPLLGHIQI